MLLLIYDNAISALQDGLRQLDQPSSAGLTTARIDAQRAILLIADGLRLEEGEVPTNVLRICIFVLEQIMTKSPQNWRASLNAIQTLREGFAAVQNEARDAEHAGRIPALNVVG